MFGTVGADGVHQRRGQAERNRLDFCAINRVLARTELSATILAVLQGMGVPVARHSVALREIYPKSATLDTVVARLVKDKKHAAAAKLAAEELDSLFTEVLNDVVHHQQAA